MQCLPNSATPQPRSPPSRNRGWCDGAGRAATGTDGSLLSEFEANFAADEARLSVERPDPQRIDVLRRFLVELVREIAPVHAREPTVVGRVVRHRRSEQRA